MHVCQFDYTGAARMDGMSRGYCGRDSGAWLACKDEVEHVFRQSIVRLDKKRAIPKRAC